MHNRGNALDKLGRNEEALASYDQALKIIPDYHQVWYNRGVVLGKLGRNEEAITSFDQALKIKPDDYEAWLNRGMAARNSVNYNPLHSLVLGIIQSNSALNQRGYEGELAIYNEGLKYCLQDKDPEGWGKLHQAIGNAHYSQARISSHHHAYWKKAANSYNEALTTLTETDFPELHLEVLRDLIKVRLDLREIAKVEELERRGTDLLRRLLDECKSQNKKQQLGLKFAGFRQLTVDLAVQFSNYFQALELAEQGKNACLNWLLDGWGDASPKWEDIQKLLNSTTAIIYWHLSPYTLHTFILKHNSKPIILKNSSLLNFEKLLKKWNEQYADYSKDQNKEVTQTKKWRYNLPKMLPKLSDILKISDIINIINNEDSQEVAADVSESVKEKSNIQNLILIPHRDLHRLPLHALFPDQFIITYLPSIQIGINLQNLSQSNLKSIHELPLLSVEHPDSKNFAILPHAEIESAIIAKLFNNPPPQRIAGEAATKAAVKTALEDNYGIFHFTGHGTYNFHNLTQSALLLNGTDSLTLNEICYIENLSQYQLVSLSACETAITGNHTITAEYVGLVSAFLSQGVSNIVSTLWTVTDDASSFLMIYFYWQVKKGKSPAMALNLARKWLRNLSFAKLERIYNLILSKLPEDEQPIRPFIERKLFQMDRISEKRQKPFNHPYYWASFIITGGLGS